MMKDFTEEDVLDLVAKYPLPDGVEDCVMTREEMAEAMVVSLPTISDWIVKGMPVKTVGGAGKSYELELSRCWAWRMAIKVDQELQSEQVRRSQAALRLALVGGKNGNSLEALDPKQRREIMEAQLVYEQFQRSRNQLMLREEVEDLLVTVFALNRDGLAFLPDKIEVRYSLPSNAVEGLVDGCDDILDVVRRKITEFWDARPLKDDRPQQGLFDA